MWPQLQRAYCIIVMGSLSAFDIIGSKACEIVGDTTGDAQLFLPVETK